ncbi:sugar porter family MFS transporter [Mucilaginibacter sp. JRF]|uniref:sugar porter family MFS transporter n=1 Tax=Mucilaginibacter sp. JRF TaxID=2780088 RepID=UPI00187F2B25|nr:sugar porter family MFS transporter [Mucilaginibacter sp. JRF]MBE9583210.1 sugar porter family MFS transporter [Mucilaginibacter sp. JRF]
MKLKPKVLLIAIIAATGGLLFGFDTGVISGALPFLKQYWHLSDASIEWLTTTVLIGAVLGALASGKLSDRVGRKGMIIINAFIFLIGAIGCAFAPSINWLIIMRIVIGIAIGITSYVVPMYIAEISPARVRGALVTLNQLMITIGILLSYITDYWLSDDADNSSWRWMFLVGFFPALVLFIGMLFLPETPRWLISKGRREQGRKIMMEIEDPEMVNQTLAGLDNDIRLEAQQSTSWTEVFKPWLRVPLIITIGIFFFQQFSGVNTIIYYSPIIFKMAGVVSNSGSIVPAIIIGAVNVAACFLSVLLLDKVGRRRLYMIGISGMIPSLLLLGACFYFKEQLGASLPYFAVISIVCFIIFIAISLAPLGWLLISEVFPLNARGIGMSIGSLAHWGFNAVIAFTFLKLVNLLGVDVTFALYALVCVAGLIWGYFYIPETKNKSLEEIEQHWRSGGSAKNL